MANAPKTVVDLTQGIVDYTKNNFTSQELLNDTVGWIGKNKFDGYFTNVSVSGILDVGNNYTNAKIERPTKAPSGTNLKSCVFGAYLKAGSYILSVNGQDYLSLNRIALAGTNCEASGVHLRYTYSFTTSVDGWTYFGIERDAGENDYTDIAFEGHDLKIMIARASETNQTYEAPHLPVEKAKFDTEAQKVAGAYNLLPLTVVSSADGGITFTVNADGTVSVSGSISTGRGNLYYYDNAALPLKAGTYKLVGKPTGATTQLWIYNNTTSTMYTDSGDGVVFPYNGTDLMTLCLRVQSPATLSTSELFKPMITPDLTATYDDYVPYCMSNRELMDDVRTIQNTIQDPFPFIYASSGNGYTINITLPDVSAYVAYSVFMFGIYATLSKPIMETIVIRNVDGTWVYGTSDPNITLLVSGSTLTITFPNKYAMINYRMAYFH